MVACKITLHVDPPCECRTIYSPLDEVSGTVTVYTKRPVSLDSIQVKLSGDLTTKIEDFYLDQKGKKRKLPRSESHEILYDSCTVFPPNDALLYSKTKSYVLPEGNFVYPFKFTIPKNSACGDRISAQYFSNIHSTNTAIESLHRTPHKKKDERMHKHWISGLPPSIPIFKGTSETVPFSFSINYRLKVTLRRSSVFKYNIRQEIPLEIRPLCSSMIDPHKLVTYSPNTLQAEGSMFNVPIALSITMTKNLYRGGNPFKGFKLVSDGSEISRVRVGHLFLTGLKINLVKELNIISSSKELYYEDKTQLLDLKRLDIPIYERDDTQEDPSLIHTLNRRIAIPDMPDSFESCCLLVNYRMEMELQFKEDSRGLVMIKSLVLPSTSLYSCLEGFSCHKIKDSLLRPLPGLTTTHPLKIEDVIGRESDTQQPNDKRPDDQGRLKTKIFVSDSSHRLPKKKENKNETKEHKPRTQEDRSLAISLNINLPGNNSENNRPSFERNYERFITNLIQPGQSQTSEQKEDILVINRFFSDDASPPERSVLATRSNDKNLVKSIKSSEVSAGLPSYQDAVQFNMRSHGYYYDW
ncbi:hypothetical protein WICPIJ_010120 [Wickerhamomyces pijperi]|uniref:Arrestin-like N-terminal domain-containing protein n=1 Tax=Wickerhamomyces pijperi TaxID=599730 RepID=A0A9P8TAQ2_WICPI|nr:hypothetical protein WICPIJ_010120 [Wickerhamomyces pijperi]